MQKTETFIVPIRGESYEVTYTEEQLKPIRKLAKKWKMPDKGDHILAAIFDRFEEDKKDISINDLRDILVCTYQWPPFLDLAMEMFDLMALIPRLLLKETEKALLEIPGIVADDRGSLLMLDEEYIRKNCRLDE